MRRVLGQRRDVRAWWSSAASHRGSGRLTQTPTPRRESAAAILVVQRRDPARLGPRYTYTLPGATELTTFQPAFAKATRNLAGHSAGSQNKVPNGSFVEGQVLGVIRQAAAQLGCRHVPAD
jgi:hypothetical protein